MKNLNLEDFGVQEMDAKEMVNVDGGGGLWDFIAGYLGGKVLDAAIADFQSRDGRQQASISQRQASMSPY